jgi:pentatricopeptide repeat protein
MNERWFTLTSDGGHNMIVGLLRDRQYELALDKLEEMQREGARIQPWLYDVFIYLFCEAEELDEALKLMQYRVDHGDTDVSPNVWYYLLDSCSAKYHVSKIFNWCVACRTNSETSTTGLVIFGKEGLRKT